MRTIPYKSWGLIPQDSALTTEEVQVINPPMMTMVALDKEASLVFQLVQVATKLLLKIEATTLSAEGMDSPCLSIFTGSASSQLHELHADAWEKSIEGLYTQFSTEIHGLELFVKLHFTGKVALVINKITFQEEEA